MLVWIFQTGEPLHVDGDNVRAMRAINLSNALVEAGHKVVLWSSDFYHQAKSHRYGKNTVIKISPMLEIRLIKSRGYSKNLSFGRLLDHAQLAWNLHKCLATETTKPDVAFIGYPPIEAAAVLAKWLRKRDVPSLLDVKDQWPNIFVQALPSRFRGIGKYAFYPYFRLARRAMHDVTGFSTHSEGFQDWVHEFSGKKNESVDGVFPLTTIHKLDDKFNLEQATSWWADRGVCADKNTKFCFVGTLSRAFNFDPVVYAAKVGLEKNDGALYVICGDGEAAEEIRRKTQGMSNVIMPGWIDRSKVIALFMLSNAALAPYKSTDDFNISVPNKIIDYMSFGLPILCPLGGDVARLVTVNRIGFPPYLDGKPSSLYDQIEAIINDETLVEQMSANAQHLFDVKFSFDRIYGSLVQTLEKLGSR